MFCYKCGKKNSEDSNFCTNCGADFRALKAGAVEKDEPPHAEAPQKTIPSYAGVNQLLLQQNPNKLIDRILENRSRSPEIKLENEELLITAFMQITGIATENKDKVLKAIESVVQKQEERRSNMKIARNSAIVFFAFAIIFYFSGSSQAPPNHSIPSAITFPMWGFVGWWLYLAFNMPNASHIQRSLRDVMLIPND